MEYTYFWHLSLSGWPMSVLLGRWICEMLGSQCGRLQRVSPFAYQAFPLFFSPLTLPLWHSEKDRTPLCRSNTDWMTRRQSDNSTPSLWLGQGSQAYTIQYSCYSVTSGAFGLGPRVSEELRALIILICCADGSQFPASYFFPLLSTVHPHGVTDAGTGIAIVSQQEQMQPQKESGFWRTVNQRNRSQSPDDITTKAHVTTGLSS